MSNNIRIRTNPNGGDTHLKVQLNQDFDFLEILSLKISQEDVYRSFYSDYGVVVGRVIMNSGVGVPNARISVFIPLTDEDAENSELKSIYPYQDLQDLNSDGVRYNTLPKDAQGVCHAPIGTFPTKRELVDNESLLEVFEKYYKYTTTTNGAGDFMLFGVPVGNHTLNIDVDLSDIGIFSQRPYDFIEQGNPKKLFESPTKFKTNTNLNNLTQVKNRQVGVNVIPFWGENNASEVGISRIDVDLNYNITPNAIFIGSIFGDNEKNSVNKNCRPRKKMGKVCEMGEGEGSIQMLRKTLYGGNERYDVEGGRVITDKGTWAYQIPMNLDYVVTDEFGNLSPTDDPTKGIPTRTNVRFKVNLDQTGGESRLRSRANYLIPHNPENNGEVNYSFDESTPDIHFRELYWNKIYTVRNHIARFQKSVGVENRNFIGFKDVDDCVGVKTPLPFNKMDTDFNPLYVVVCVIVSIILEIIELLNGIIKLKILILGRLCVLLNIGCVSIDCNGLPYSPGCSSSCGNSGNNNAGDALDCFQIALATALNIFKFDFYNEWLNGSLYSFLFKYKKPKNSDPKFCGDGNGDGNNHILNTNAPGTDTKTPEQSEIEEGVIASYEGELFYKPLTEKGHKFYSTDLYNLGAVFPCDWQEKPKIQTELIGTTYQIPPLTKDSDGIKENDVTPIDGLLFDLNCLKANAGRVQSTSIRRICEIGVGLDEYQINDPNDGSDDIPNNREIDNNDIDNTLLRSNLIKLNDVNYYNFSVDNINSDFKDGDEYDTYRNKKVVAGITQFFGNSFYFYFGTQPNNGAIELMNSKYFTSCSKIIKNDIIITGNITGDTNSSIDINNGSIEAIVNGGTPEYFYEWYDSNNNILPNGSGIGVNVVTGLAGGSYYVIVTDKCDELSSTRDECEGKQIKKTFVVNGLLDLSVDVSTINASSSSSLDGGMIFNVIEGGVSPYEVSIIGRSPIVFNETFNDIVYSLNVGELGVGLYDVVVKDSNIPIDDKSLVVEITVPSTLEIINFNPTNTSCYDFDDGSIIFQVIGGTPEYNVILKDGNGINYSVNESANNTYKYNDLPSNTYSLSIVDTLSQTFDKTITLTKPNELVLSAINLKYGDYKYTCTNTLSGVQYNLEDELSVTVDTFVGGGTIIRTITTASMSEYQVVSEFGCGSNIL
jgi:hypothetical protein